MSKNKRTLQVYKTISQLKNGSLDEILARVAQAMDKALPDDSLKRAVRRDLNALIEGNIVHIAYFTPSGDPILPDEESEHKNKRARYILLESQKDFYKGQGALDQFGIEVISHESMKECINFTLNFNEVPKGAACVAFDLGGSAFVFLWLEVEDLPLNLQFSRKEGESLSQPEMESIKADLSPRSLMILIGHQSVSRMKSSPYRGQLLVHFSGETLSIQDQFQSGSVQVSKVEDWSEVIKMFPTGQETVEFPRIPFHWETVESKVDKNVDHFVKVGDMLVLPMIKA